MSESLVGCISKIDQEAMRAAMEAMARAGATNLGRGPAIFRTSVLHFQIFGRVFGQAIWLHLSAFKSLNYFKKRTAPLVNNWRLRSFEARFCDRF